MPAGSWPREALIAACTSRAAALMSVPGRTRRDARRALRAVGRDLGHARDAPERALERRRRRWTPSSPGSHPAATALTPRSSESRPAAAATRQQARKPARPRARPPPRSAASRDGPGRRVAKDSSTSYRRSASSHRSSSAAAGRARCSAEPIEEQVDDRRREQRQHLAHEQAADHDEAERLAQLGARARGQHQRQRAEQRRQRRHQDRAEAQQRRLVDRVVAATCPRRARPRARSRSS